MFKKLLKAVCLTAVLIVLWYAFSAIVGKPFVPMPHTALAAFANGFFTKIVPHSLYSLARITAAVFAAVLSGYTAGLWIGCSDRADSLVFPLVSVIYPVPKIAFLPVIMLLFGLGELSRIISVYIIIVFQIVVTVRDNLKSADPSLYYPLTALNAGKWDTLRFLLIPVTLKGLVSSVRTALATSLSVLFFSETFGTDRGLGFFIMDSMFRVNYAEMYAGILAIGLIGGALFYVLGIIEKKFVK